MHGLWDCCADVWFAMYRCIRCIKPLKRPPKKLTKAGRKYHKQFSNHQAMTRSIPKPFVQLFAIFLQLFLHVFLQFLRLFLQSCTVFFTFFTAFYKSLKWAGDLGAGFGEV